MPPTYYRGCWHVVSRGFLVRYHHCAIIPYGARFSLTTELYDPKTFFIHAALLRQAFAHCGKFPTAASRRSLGRVSVPMWPVTLSGRLCIIALVSRYLTNQLMHRRLIRMRGLGPFSIPKMPSGCSSCISCRFQPLSTTYGQIAHVLLTRSPLGLRKQASFRLVRLACIRHAASVHPEPGSNSPFAHSFTLSRLFFLFAFPLFRIHRN